VPKKAEELCRLGSGPRARRSGLAPVEDELPFGEVPTTVNLGERVKVSGRGDHDLPLTVFGEEVVGDRVALAGGAVAVDRDRALAAPNVTPFPGTFGSTPNGISDPWVYDQVPNALQVGYGTFQIGTDPKAADFNTQIGMRDHSMRTPAQRQQNFAQESMMSELAAAAKVDQVQFRINNTSDPRVINVMKAVRDNSSWWETRPSRRTRRRRAAPLS
jgi:hypothetical protein